MAVGDLSTVARVALAAVALYLYVLAVLRVSGNRALSKMRAFDLVVTIALGSLLAGGVVTGSGTTLLQAATAITALIILQEIVAALSRASVTANALATSPPLLLYHGGEFVDRGLARAGVTPSQVLMAMRAEGVADEREAAAVILEPNGDFTVLRRVEPGETGTTRNVTGVRPGEP